MSANALCWMTLRLYRNQRAGGSNRREKIVPHAGSLSNFRNRFNAQ
jgi:hypothetical protein